MHRYILRRGIQAVITMWILSIVVFGLVRMTGNPLDLLLPPEATKEDYAQLAEKLGLDKPVLVQYGIYFLNALHGDLGNSIRYQRPAAALVWERLPATLALGAIAVPLALIIAIPIGIYASQYRGTSGDFVARGFAVLGQSMPHFWTGVVLILVFAVWIRWLPPGGKAGPESYILPVITLGYYAAAGVMRLTRSAMLEVLGSEYIKLARAKGLRESVVIWKHAFKNASIPVLTFSAVIFVRVLMGSVVTETVFAWPGIGRLVIESVEYRDFPIVQTVILLMSAMFIFGNLLADVLYAYVNPKIRY